MPAVSAKHLKAALDRNVQIRCKSSCANGFRDREASGVVYRSGLVVSVDHVQDRNTIVYVNGVESKVLHEDEELDLLLIAAPTQDFESLSFQHDCDLLEPVFYVGNVLGVKDFVSYGLINHVAEDRILTSTHGITGSSGSCLWHAETGRPIGIMFEANKKGTVGMAIPGRVVERFVAEGIRNSQQRGNLKLFFTGT
jgi:hypothetical protein